MKAILLKALQKKKKYLQQKNYGINNSKNCEDSDLESDSESDSDSDGSLSSEDEVEVSKDWIYKWLNSRYIIVKYLGRGTFCRTWLVYDINEYIFVAIKMYFPKYYEDSLNEIKINKKLTSNNYVVKLLDNFVYENHNCLVFQLLGITLHDINEYYDYRIPLDILKTIVYQILQGVNELHKNNIIHCDLKPENVMFNIYPNIIKEINTLSGLKESYLEIFKGALPEGYDSFNKSKKKKFKKKVKNKCNTLFSELLKTKISNLNETDRRFTINNNAIKVYLIDLGNSEILGNKNEDEIMIRSYRPPENIMNNFYNEKADIWSLGCIIYELLTSEYLFDIDRDLSYNDKNRQHLAQMEEIFGRVPKDLALKCEYKEDLFDKNGIILGFDNIDTVNLSNKLESEFGYSKEDSIALSDFLKLFFEYDVNKRESASSILSNEWLNEINKMK